MRPPFSSTLSKRLLSIAVSAVLWATQPLLADGPADNNQQTARPVPPPGIAVPEERRHELSNRLD